MANKSKPRTWVLRDPVTGNYLHSLKLDAFKTPGIAMVHQVTYTTFRKEALKVAGVESFARGYCACINSVFNTNYEPKLMNE